ncbi:MAG: undecaprenyldiphospho-muramoylpentapeptide beta-N-acetylglucosaminyltransferase [Acidobacteriaceae bacterium]
MEQGQGTRFEVQGTAGGGVLRVLIAGGGTGGHVIPALAIARELRSKHGAEVRFVGTARGLETRLVPDAGFLLQLVRSGQLKNVSLATRARTMIDVPKGVVECVRLIRSFRPHVVIGVGGYASGPGMLAALLLRVPTLAFEPNAVPGLANRLVGEWVTAAAVNFEQTRSYFRNAVVTGVPVRQEFFEVPPLRGWDKARPSLTYIPEELPPPQLLVFGGSQGARVFNRLFPTVVASLLKQVPGLTVLHQAGAGQVAVTEQAYRQSGADPARWQLAEFLDDMPKRFAEAQLIVCRSGASTVAELAAAGRAAVLVPFPDAADDHQLKNAEVFQRIQAAELLYQGSDEQLSYLLLEHLPGLLRNPARCAQMGERARTLAHPRAVMEIGRMVAQMARRAELNRRAVKGSRGANSNG